MATDQRPPAARHAEPTDEQWVAAYRRELYEVEQRERQRRAARMANRALRGGRDPPAPA